MPDKTTHVLHCEDFDFVIEHSTVREAVDNGQWKQVVHYELKQPGGGETILELTKEELIQIHNFRTAHQ